MGVQQQKPTIEQISINMYLTKKNPSTTKMVICWFILPSKQVCD